MPLYIDMYMEMYKRCWEDRIRIGREVSLREKVGLAASKGYRFVMLALVATGDQGKIP